MGLIGLVIIAVLVGLGALTLYMVSGTKRLCPFCHSTMPKTAIKCPHCFKAVPLGY